MENVRIINLSFQIWGSILSLLIMFTLLIAKKVLKKGEKIYFAMLGINMLTMIMDVLALYFRGRTGGFAWFGVRFTNYFEFVCGNILPVLLVCYIKEYIESRHNTKINRGYLQVTLFMFILVQIMLVVNLFLPFFYVIDSNNIYSRLPFYFLMYIPMYGTLIVALIMLIRNWKYIKSNAAFAFIVYIIIPILSLLGSILYYGITFSYIGTTAALTCFFLFLQFDRYNDEIIKNATDTVEQLKDYEKLINEGIKLSMENENPEVNINAMLQYLGEVFESDRVFLFEIEDLNSYEWRLNDNIQLISSNQLLNICKYLQKEYSHNQIFVVKNVDELKDQDSIMYEWFKELNISSLVSCPLLMNHEIIGLFGFTNASNEGLNISYDILEIITSFNTSLLKKRNLIRELKHLSHTDVATGARNRLAMYDYFKTLTNKKDIGVVFCDITGLKNTNDTQGHSAGDELIKNTYYCLKEEFADESIFRIGGDEFVIICDGIIEEVFNKKINDLRKTFNDKKMIVAIGTECRDRVAENVKKTIINAENKMYEEKNEWYNNNGDKANRR